MRFKIGSSSSRQQVALRAYLTKLRDVAFLEIKAGIRRHRRGSRQGHEMERSGAAEARDRDQRRGPAESFEEKGPGIDPDSGHESHGILFVALAVNEVALS